MTEALNHRPVMTEEIVETLRPRDGGVYLDGTFGGGGHARALLAAADCLVIALDRDPDAIKRGRLLQADCPKRLTLMEGRFSDLAERLHQTRRDRLDGIAMDVGVSSFQLDDAERGFSFQQSGPLDMRMEGAQSKTKSAAQWIEILTEKELADIIARYGEERHAKRIARAIVMRRETQPITRTDELASLIKRAVGEGERRGRGRGIHPATRTFQAFRILVNDELNELAKALYAAERLLRAGGRLAVITFHSLEDRIVKRFLRSRAGGEPHPSRHMPPLTERHPPSFRLIGRGVRRPLAREISRNPRARAAKLRAAERNSHPPRPFPLEALAS